MRKFSRPKVVISKCFEFENVRYDGGVISSVFVKKLMPHLHGWGRGDQVVRVVVKTPTT